ncbi:MAG TPA: TetR/AcrR family transcriptional regulator [Solirubrobacteraceae bacterium]|jgi:AcrR family transcriptional regulator|nr:TetR/AcrR family transcriptional regulator [Solirubrobacteraceae bacterium]
MSSKGDEPAERGRTVVVVRGPLSREQVVELQRERIMRATVRVVAERGFGGASIARVIAAAGVSRATFYELFGSFERCFLAVVNAAMRRTSASIAQAFERNAGWQERAVAGLVVLLSALDSDPLLARVCLVEVLGAGPAALEYHARELELLKHIVASAAGPARAGRYSSALSAEAVVVSVAGILHRRVVSGEAPPFVDLLVPLAGVALVPYLDAGAVAQAQERAGQLARELSEELATRRARPAADVAIPKVLVNPRAHRSRECLRYLADHPGSSNREVGEGIGLVRIEQAGRLLARLAREGLLVKRAGRLGHPNAWSLTPRGEQIAQALAEMSRDHPLANGVA